MEPTQLSPPTRWAVVTAYVAGGLLAVVPLLVEFVVGDFIVLMPIALLLSVIAPFGLRIRRRRAFPLFVVALVVALVSETVEQVIFPDSVPWLADVVPPAAFVLTGLALLATAVDAAHERSNPRQVEIIGPERVRK
jgi:hypothetical protein